MVLLVQVRVKEQILRVDLHKYVFKARFSNNKSMQEKVLKSINWRAEDKGPNPPSVWVERCNPRAVHKAVAPGFGKTVINKDFNIATKHFLGSLMLNCYCLFKVQFVRKSDIFCQTFLGALINVFQKNYTDRLIYNHKREKVNCNFSVLFSASYERRWV